MPASANLSKTELRQRRNLSVNHGATGAHRQLNAGKPFSGMATEVYQQTIARWGHTDADLDASGMMGDLVRETARHQTVSDMCYALTIAAASAGDLETWDRWVRLWCRISNRGISHMKQLKEMLDNDSALDYELILRDPAEVQPE